MDAVARTPRRILLVGGGGREHALAVRLAGEPGVAAVVALPGSDAIAGVRGVSVVPGDPLDASVVVAAARAARVDLAVIGPEAPLAAGVADALVAAGIPTFGPTAAAARIESSKAFCHAIADAAGVRMARAGAFAAPGPALAFAAELSAGGRGIVIKADAWPRARASRSVTRSTRRRWPLARSSSARVPRRPMLPGSSSRSASAGRRPA